MDKWRPNTNNGKHKINKQLKQIKEGKTGKDEERELI